MKDLSQLHVAGPWIIPFLIDNVSFLMQNTKRVFCHIPPDCAVPRFISKQPVMREKLIEMVLLEYRPHH